jgi:hypothetical protein
MPALGASEDARERAYVAGIHVFLLCSTKTWMAPELGLARVPYY